jgi:hypothetical protein
MDKCCTLSLFYATFMPPHKKGQLVAAARARAQRHPKATVTTKDSLLHIPNEQIPTSMEEIIPDLADELNFIEFFWGLVKKYLRNNCDYTFNTLKENKPKALASIKLETIRRWEHRVVRWMTAYWAGMGIQDVPLHVHKFSSTTYSLHRRIPERVAIAYDRD